jgi:hypothetical protein
MPDARSLIEKIKALPADTIPEVEDFVDFVAARAQGRSLVREASAASESAFSKIWNNPEDDVYDAL